MAKIIITSGDTAILTSDLTLDNIRTLQKYAPKKLTLVETDEDGKKSVTACVSISTNPGINAVGVAFPATTRDPEGKAVLSLRIPEDVKDAKEWVTDKFGPMLVKLNKIERQIPDALAQVESDRAEAQENIVTF